VRSTYAQGNPTEEWGAAESAEDAPRRVERSGVPGNPIGCGPQEPRGLPTGGERPRTWVPRWEWARGTEGRAEPGSAFPAGVCPGHRRARTASRGTHLPAGRPGSAAHGHGAQRPRLRGLRWAPVAAEPRRRCRCCCTAAFRFLSRRRPAAPAQPCEPGAAASQELRALRAPPRARPTCSGGRGRPRALTAQEGAEGELAPPPLASCTRSHSCTLAIQHSTRLGTRTHTHTHTHIMNIWLTN
jgi:hypothetical protein